MDHKIREKVVVLTTDNERTMASVDHSHTRTGELWRVKSQTIRRPFFRLETAGNAEIKRKLRISVTDGCNFSCFFCHNEGQGPLASKPSSLSVSEITRAVKIAVEEGIQSVKLTGGEPLIFRDGDQTIVDLVSAISDLRQSGHDFELSLISNGWLLEKFATDLANAGLDRVTVSLHTLNQSLFESHFHGGSGSVDRVMDGINIALDAGLRPLKVNVVLFHSRRGRGSNIREIPKIVHLCKQLDVDELRFYTLLWHPCFEDFDEYYIFWDSEILSQIPWNGCEEEKSAVLDELRNLSDDWAERIYPKVSLLTQVDGLSLAFEVMQKGRFTGQLPCIDCPHPEKCQEGPYSLRLSSDGDLRGCLLSDRCINIVDHIREGLTDSELRTVFRRGFALLPKDSVINDHDSK